MDQQHSQVELFTVNKTDNTGVIMAKNNILQGLGLETSL